MARSHARKLFPRFQGLACLLGVIGMLGGTGLLVGTCSAADYMLGLKCRETRRVAAEGQDDVGGLLVQDVLEDGPADQAGIRRGQLLVRAGERPLRSLEDLRVVVQECQGKPLQLTVRTELDGDVVRQVQPVPREDRPLLARELEQRASDAESLPGIGDLLSGEGGLGGLLKNLGPAADLLNLGDIDIEIRRGPPRDDADALRQLQNSRDPIALYGRINVGQLLGAFWPDRSENQETERLREEVRELRRELETLKKRLEGPPEVDSPSDR